MSTSSTTKTSDDSNKSAFDAALAAMADGESRSMFDVTIVCTTDDFQAEYWMKRLSEGICRPKPQSKTESEEKTTSTTTTTTTTESGEEKAPKKAKIEKENNDTFPIVLAVSEDWNSGGAGNGLGTLYAYQKACKQAKERHDIDLDALLHEKKVSAGLYHTAGKGTRLAPLPASENNNKPGVKLPFCHQLVDGSLAPITVLEAVVKQTGIYAPSRNGRLSVFWGDQVFIPSAPFNTPPTHHADIMCTLLGETAPTAEEWTEQGLDKYGVIAVAKGSQKNAAQVEKVDHATAVQMLKTLGDIGQVGPSLGSFSVSASLLRALCQEFDSELQSKTGKFDTDPHFWMPLTLPESDYISLMKQKNVSSDESMAHHQRMAKMKQSFEKNNLSDDDTTTMGLFGAVNVGKDAAWWDYGQLKKYASNNLKLLDHDENSNLLRQFLGVTSRQMQSNIGSSTTTVDDDSCIFGCNIQSGSISKSILASVVAKEVQIGDHAIVLNCTAKKIIAGPNSILYNIIADVDDDKESTIIAKDGDVIVSVTDESGSTFELRSKHTLCGGKNWKVKLEGNDMTFEEVHGKNKNANVTVIENKRRELFKKASDSFGM